MRITEKQLRGALDSLPNAEDYRYDYYIVPIMGEIELTFSYTPEKRSRVNELIFRKGWNTEGCYWELTV